MPRPETTAPPIETVADNENVGRKIEAWVVVVLGARPDSPDLADDWQDLVGRLAPSRQTARRGDRRARPPGGWGRFRISTRKGVTVVTLTDRHLIKDHELNEFAGDLLAVVNADRHRLLLNFMHVERLSSWAVSAVAEACRRCLAGGGALKVCSLRPQLAAIFSITGLDRSAAIHPDAPPTWQVERIGGRVRRYTPHRRPDRPGEGRRPPGTAAVDLLGRRRVAEGRAEPRERRRGLGPGDRRGGRPAPRLRPRRRGALRVCEANPRVSAVFEQVRLAMIVDCHPTVDDAVLSGWPG